MVKVVGPITVVPIILVLSIQLFTPFYYKIFAFCFPMFLSTITTYFNFGRPPAHCAARRNELLPASPNHSFLCPMFLFSIKGLAGI
jgi:hypothetical protein